MRRFQPFIVRDGSNLSGARTGMRFASIEAMRHHVVIASIAAFLFGALASAASPAATSHSLETLRAQLGEAVRARLATLSGPGTLLIEVGALDPRLRLEACGHPLQIEAPAGLGNARRIAVRASCAGPQRWSIHVPVAIEREASVLVARRTLARGEVPTGADLRTQVMRLPGIDVAHVSEAAQLQGRRLRAPVAAGAPIPLDALAPDLIVKRGQQVMLVAAGGGVEVRAPGTALGSAGASERVRVQNASSLRVVEGVVGSDGLVRIGP